MAHRGLLHVAGGRHLLVVGGNLLHITCGLHVGRHLLDVGRHLLNVGGNLLNMRRHLLGVVSLVHGLGVHLLRHLLRDYLLDHLGLHHLLGRLLRDNLLDLGILLGDDLLFIVRVVEGLGLEVVHGLDVPDLVLGLMDNDGLFDYVLDLLGGLVDGLLGRRQALVHHTLALGGVHGGVSLGRVVGEHVLHLALDDHGLLGHHHVVALEEGLFLVLEEGLGRGHLFLLEDLLGLFGGLFGPVVDVLEGGTVGRFFGEHSPDLANVIAGVVVEQTGEGVFYLVPPDLQTLPVVEFAAGPKRRDLQHGHAEGEDVALEDVVLLLEVLLAEGVELFGGGQHLVFVLGGVDQGLGRTQDGVVVDVHEAFLVQV